MPLSLLIRGLSKHLRSPLSDHNSYFLSEAEFQHQIACERMRVDRNGSLLALLTIALPADRRLDKDYSFLAKVLADRLRITDTSGRLSDGRLGVLLPDTDESGAWKVASDVCDRYDVGHARPDCQVLIYPDQDGDVADDSLAGEGQPVGKPIPTLDASLEAFQASNSPAWKRWLDVVGASCGLVISAPIILMAGAAVRLTSAGPMFYLQEREGFGGRRFHIIKLRTMRDGADRHRRHLQRFSEQDGPAFKMSNDPRITPVGKWLRFLSLDELPQFWNVLRGEMSLVGPRPLPTDESLRCDPWQRRRLLVKPGMTCIWQVRGRNTVSFNEWVRMDLQYVRRRSFWYDLQLLVETVPSLVRQRGPR
jgi:lipopolysaccharide/colanic/teichoic acid biosynthesis glycosyltransferase